MKSQSYHRKFRGDPGLQSLSPPQRSSPRETTQRGIVSLPDDAPSLKEDHQDDSTRQEDDLIENTAKQRARIEPSSGGEWIIEKAVGRKVGRKGEPEELPLSYPTPEPVDADIVKKDFKTRTTKGKNQQQSDVEPTDLERGANHRPLSPGAVAVGGVQAGSTRPLYDSLVSTRTPQDSDTHDGDPSSRPVSADALEIVVPQAVLVQEGEELVHATASDGKNHHKWRMTFCIVMAILVAVGVTVGVVVGTRSSGDSSSDGSAVNETNVFCGDGIIGNGTCQDGLCCSEFGFCGVTDEFCINGQVPPNVTTDEFCGNGIVGNGTCPGLLCCSDFGFCGSTAEFCKNGQEIPGSNEFCGDGIVGNGTCKDGFCCSEFGFCGVTPDFCINGQTPP